MKLKLYAPHNVIMMMMQYLIQTLFELFSDDRKRSKEHLFKVNVDFLSSAN